MLVTFLQGPASRSNPVNDRNVALKQSRIQDRKHGSVGQAKTFLLRYPSGTPRSFFLLPALTYWDTPLLTTETRRTRRTHGERRM
jgi:hypothetical protein